MCWEILTSCSSLGHFFALTDDGEDGGQGGAVGHAVAVAEAVHGAEVTGGSGSNSSQRSRNHRETNSSRLDSFFTDPENMARVTSYKAKGSGQTCCRISHNS